MEAKKKVLVVDDEEHIVNLVKLTLESDFEVFGAYSGKEALENAKKHSPDLILLDIMMPEMDGYEVMRAMRKDDDLKKIPVIFLTAKGEWNDKMKALALGGSADYITKPFEPDDLLRRTRTAFE